MEASDGGRRPNGSSFFFSPPSLSSAFFYNLLCLIPRNPFLRAKTKSSSRLVRVPRESSESYTTHSSTWGLTWVSLFDLDRTPTGLGGCRVRSNSGELDQDSPIFQSMMPKHLLCNKFGKVNFMTNPRNLHLGFVAFKRIIRYLHGTFKFRSFFSAPPTVVLIGQDPRILIDPQPGGVCF